MSAVGEALLRTLVQAKSAVSRPQTGHAPSDSWSDYVRWQYESSARLFARYPNFDPAGKRVLEIGCGTGGRTAYLAAAGAREAVGIDINAAEIEVARRSSAELFPDIVGRCTFHASREDAPLDIGTFDRVVLVDCMEHVVSPPSMMKLAHSYTAPGGRFYFSSVGWYHYLGSHLDLIPFVNVFFSDDTIINVERWRLSRPDYVPNRWDSDPPVRRWEGVSDLKDRPGEHLNKITIRQMKRLIEQSPFRRSRLTIVGFGDNRPPFRLLDPLRHVPVIQEMYHSLAVADCER